MFINLLVSLLPLVFIVLYIKRFIKYNGDSIREFFNDDEPYEGLDDMGSYFPNGIIECSGSVKDNELTVIIHKDNSVCHYVFDLNTVVIQYGNRFSIESNDGVNYIILPAGVSVHLY